MSDNGVFKDSNLFSLNKSTYVNLRWIAYTGQIITILIVQFFLEYNFNYFICISIIFFRLLSEWIQFRIIFPKYFETSGDVKKSPSLSDLT